MSSRFGLILNAEMCLCELQRMQFSYPMADEGGDRETFDVISMVPALARSLFSSAAIASLTDRIPKTNNATKRLSNCLLPQQHLRPLLLRLNDAAAAAADDFQIFNSNHTTTQPPPPG